MRREDEHDRDTGEQHGDAEGQCGGAPVVLEGGLVEEMWVLSDASVAGRPATDAGCRPLASTPGRPGSRAAVSGTTAPSAVRRVGSRLEFGTLCLIQDDRLEPSRVRPSGEGALRVLEVLDDLAADVVRQMLRVGGGVLIADDAGRRRRCPCRARARPARRRGCRPRAASPSRICRDPTRSPSSVLRRHRQGDPTR